MVESGVNSQTIAWLHPMYIACSRRLLVPRHLAPIRRPRPSSEAAARLAEVRLFSSMCTVDKLCEAASKQRAANRIPVENTA